MNLPEHARSAALADTAGAISDLRTTHYWEQDEDYDESGNRIVIDGCACGADWPCPVATLLMLYDDLVGFDQIA